VTDGQANIDKPQRKESARHWIKDYFVRFFSLSTGIFLNNPSKKGFIESFAE
jgi:hypothetical protein